MLSNAQSLTIWHNTCQPEGLPYAQYPLDPTVRQVLGRASWLELPLPSAEAVPGTVTSADSQTNSVDTIMCGCLLPLRSLELHT